LLGRQAIALPFRRIVSRQHAAWSFNVVPCRRHGAKTSVDEDRDAVAKEHDVGAFFDIVSGR
jgi:hypothetical protein